VCGAGSGRFSRGDFVISGVKNSGSSITLLTVK
jgi:hypothetical protein